MDKNAIKKYATWARRELISRVSQKAAFYEITEKDHGTIGAENISGRVLNAAEKKQRDALIRLINKDGYEQAMEEVAYTWFNRFCALRYMEVNNYLPSHVRVFTNDEGAFKPQILSEAINLELDGLDMDLVYAYKENNELEKLYRYLLIVQCNALNSILPGLFQTIEDYTELLLPDNLLREGSVIEQMVALIPEKDWTDQVQIIGWLYQYYIAEPKDRLINAKKQYKSNEVPFVTQIFTSDWIVQYMVQNSLGRLWTEATGDDYKQFEWEYYLDTENNSYKEKDLSPEEIRIVDPCMGSGHILAYAFDVLMQIYEKRGYSKRDAAEKIITKNLFGMDISERAYQLAYFSIMMKARKYSRRVLEKGISPNLFLLNNLSLSDDVIRFVASESKELTVSLRYMQSQLKDINDFGSLVQPCKDDFPVIRNRLKEIKERNYEDLINQSYQNICNTDVTMELEVVEAMSVSYDVVITNPPYIGNRLLPSTLRSYIENNYRDFKSDIFAAFVDRVIKMCKKDGYIGMLTPYVWMFIGTYENLRREILSNTTITSLVQLEYNAFEAACVPVCSFTLKKEGVHPAGEYVRLSEFRGADIQGIKVKEAVQNSKCGYRYTTDQNEYELIPGSPIAFWVDKKIINCFNEGKRVDSFAFPKQGLATADNNRFLRLWFEVDINKAAFSMKSGDEAQASHKKWFPYNKGGGYKKWYGNNEYLVNWENSGYEICNFKDEKGKLKSRPQNIEWFFKEGLSWCKITSSSFSMRYIPEGFLFDVAGCTLFVDKSDILYVLGYMNAKINGYILALISPTLNFEVGHVGSLPIIFDESHRKEIERLVRDNINLCKEDWDSYENSWDFQRSPLVNSGKKLAEIYEGYKERKESAFFRLQENETELNRIFAQIYNADNILNSDVPPEEVIIGRADYVQDMKALISYAVGCMFGRYSLDKPGIAYAGGEWSNDLYLTLKPDADNIIPICDDEYFEDDIVAKFIEFVKVAYGEEYLEENLKFIAEALPYNGSARERLRQYFINDFFTDHCDLYTSRGAGKRPIYWLFDSGKKNGFKCLIYMHRYRTDTIARIRTDYVHEQQSRYRTAIMDLEKRVANATTSERVKLNKQLTNIQAQSEELRLYEEKIHHLADQMISIDLDDGVKNNYAIFQDVLAKIK